MKHESFFVDREISERELTHDMSDKMSDKLENLAYRERIAELEGNVTEAVQANTYLLSVNEKLEERIAELERQLADMLLKDRGKTTEINLLVAENRMLTAALKKAGVDIGALKP